MLKQIIGKHLRRKWAELSWGELFDKISILRVKMNRMRNFTKSDLEKLKHVRENYLYLSKHLDLHMRDIFTRDELSVAYDLMEKLYTNNHQQWDYENAMSMTGDEVPVELRLQAMKNSYTQNRGRAIIKRKIDELFGSEWLEIKQYDGMKNES